MSVLWKNWCRLCGNDSGSHIDIFVKNDNKHNLSVAISKYFNILIARTDDLPSKICLMCLQTIISIIKYDEQSLRVQQMFLELKESEKIEIKFSSLRGKYGLDGEPNYLNSGNDSSSQEKLSLDLKDYMAESFRKQEVCNSTNTTPAEKPDINNVLKIEIIEDESEFLDSTNYIEETTATEKNLVNANIGKKSAELQMNTSSSVDNSTKKKRKRKQVLKYISEEDDVPEQDKLFECTVCQKRFITARERTLHLKHRHSTEIGPPPYACSACNKLFKKFQNLTAHELTHLPDNQRKVFSCSLCDKKFAYEWYIEDHIRMVHKRERPYVCEICGAAFGSIRNLTDHHLTHSEEKKFQCTKCNKTFKCKRALKLHIDIHDDTQYICPICGLQLNTKRILRRHMIVHSDLNKYKCNFCSKEFKRPDAFKNHLILHTGLKPYQCPFCELTFANGSNCRKHERTTHPVELAAAELLGKQRIAKNVPSIKQLKAVNEEAVIETKDLKLRQK